MKLYPNYILSTIICIVAGLCISHAAHAQNISGVVNTYHKVTAINTTTNALTLGSAAGLSPGVKIIIIQMKGAVIDNTNTATFGNITSVAEAGNYEFNYICGVNGNDVLLMYDLQRNYDVSGLVQIVTVPRYTAAIVTDTLKAIPWNAAQGTGGIIALQATSISLLAPIDADAAGFAGGAYIDHPIPPNNCDWSNNITNYFLPDPPTSAYAVGGNKGEGITASLAAIQFGKGKLANGGGGGNNHNAGGAGGSNYGAGGSGGMRSNEGSFNCHGQNPGIGGLALSAYGYSAGSNRVFLGGGGGAGQGNNNVGMPGGNGGGLVFIIADTLYGNGQLIRANGAAPYRSDLANPWAAGGDGGGGGGGGGAIMMDITYYSGNITAEARGGAGSESSYTPSSGCFGPGGGGGGGTIWVKGGTVNPLLSTSVTGGINGLISTTTSVAACRGLANGASAGANGAVLTNYAAPAITGFICAPLPLNDLLLFTGRETGEEVEVSWKMRKTTDIHEYQLERSIDRVSFAQVAKLANNHLANLSVIDKDAGEAFVYYRLKVIYNDGSVLYSSIILVQLKNSVGLQLVRMSPNPAKNRLGLVIRSDVQSVCELEIYSRTSQKILSESKLLKKGMNQVQLSIETLAEGMYFMVIRQDGKRIVRPFIRQN